MDRQIKFRAWISPLGKMFYNVGIDPALKQVRYEGRQLATIPNAIPLQFTELLDQNGKEIYEGDIVACAKKGRRAKPPYWKKDTIKIIEWGAESSGYSDEELAYSYTEAYGWNLIRGDEYIVIGNIYENPELVPKCNY
jgi:uncharacterized phage protein (TIGR01671 family)